MILGDDVEAGSEVTNLAAGAAHIIPDWPTRIKIRSSLPRA
jgi:hypothetical protein